METAVSPRIATAIADIQEATKTGKSINTLLAEKEKNPRYINDLLNRMRKEKSSPDKTALFAAWKSYLKRAEKPGAKKKTSSDEKAERKFREENRDLIREQLKAKFEAARLALLLHLKGNTHPFTYRSNSEFTENLFLVKKTADELYELGS